MHREKQAQGLHFTLYQHLSFLIASVVHGIASVWNMWGLRWHLGVFSVSACWWHSSPMNESWTGTRIENKLLQLLHCSAWHSTLSGAIKQTPAEWLTPQAALCPGAELGAQCGTGPFPSLLLSVSCPGQWFRAACHHGHLAKVAVLSLECPQWF